MKSITLYDVFTKQDIFFEEGQIGKKCRDLGIAINSIWRLVNSSGLHINDRYILQENKNKIFTLINKDTGVEYDCITVSSLRKQLKLSIHKGDEAKICQLKSKNTYCSFIYGSNFILKNGKELLQMGPDIILYDIFKDKDILIPYGSLLTTCEVLGFDYTAVSKLGKESKCIRDRYILPEDKEKIFTLIELDTGKEYNCINNNSLFLQLNYPYSDNEGKYIYELKRGRQNFSSICGKVFYLKSNEEKIFSGAVKLLKNSSSVLLKLVAEQDKQRKIKNLVMGRISHAMKKHSERVKRPVKKKYRTNKYLGCSIEFYNGYLEALFLPGIGWDNRGQTVGTWQIDHVIPCSSFDLENDDESLKCFHYSNTRPLWADENLLKSDDINNSIIRQHQENVRLLLSSNRINTLIEKNIN